MRKVISAVIFGSMVAFVLACEDQQVTKLQYMPDMADTPGVKTQKEYIDPPEGSIAVTDIPYAATPEEETLLQNPIPADQASIARGDKLFHTFCSVCHGSSGKGDGTIVDEFPPPPDLTSDLNKGRPDPFFFNKISKGGPLMPSLGYALDMKERWHIVNYLRTLQGVAK